jgi:hypothetical protein
VSKFAGCLWALLISTLLGGDAAWAQEASPASSTNQDVATSAVPSWAWSVSTQVFAGVNYQRRKFTDFDAWEAQNWVMATGERFLGTGATRLSAMLSLESFTMKNIGSPQVFQTGETFRGAPLIDYQHPHDLFMNLGVEHRGTAGRVRFYGGADLVGSPTLGPVAFMHRPSASANPQAPLSHHYLDSTHITPGVLRAGLGTATLMGEASWFHGREPDEDRTDIDLGRLDSYAVRILWTAGRWSAQMSAAHLTQPEAVTPYDAKRVSASVSFSDAAGRLSAWTAAFGQNREIHGNLEAYLFEAQLRALRSDVVYLRVESVAKDILDAGFHPRGVFHRHRQSQVGAFTVGYLRTLIISPAGSIGVGGDITMYAVAANLEESYGSPLSAHAFLRWTFAAGAPTVHRH